MLTTTGSYSITTDRLFERATLYELPQTATHALLNVAIKIVSNVALTDRTLK